MKLIYRWRDEPGDDPQGIRFDSYEDVVRAVERFGLSGGALENLECLRVEPAEWSSPFIDVEVWDDSAS